jgi:hypothetical protein
MRFNRFLTSTRWMLTDCLLSVSKGSRIYRVSFKCLNNGKRHANILSVAASSLSYGSLITKHAEMHVDIFDFSLCTQCAHVVKPFISETYSAWRNEHITQQILVNVGRWINITETLTPTGIPQHFEQRVYWPLRHLTSFVFTAFI